MLATCATCSSPSTAASTCLGRTAGSMPDGSCQTGSIFRQTGTESSVAFRLKEVIDGRVLKASRAKRKKRYHYPNERVLLPLASWSSSGVSAELSAQASISPIRSRARSVHRYPISGPSQGTASAEIAFAT